MTSDCIDVCDVQARLILAYDFDVEARQDCTPDQEAAYGGDTLLVLPTRLSGVKLQVQRSKESVKKSRAADIELGLV